VPTRRNRKLVVVLNGEASTLDAIERALRAEGIACATHRTVEDYLAGAKLSEANRLFLNIPLKGVWLTEPASDAFSSGTFRAHGGRLRMRLI
jgi:hypothetical protein